MEQQIAVAQVSSAWSWVGPALRVDFLARSSGGCFVCEGISRAVHRNLLRGPPRFSESVPPPEMIGQRVIETRVIPLGDRCYNIDTSRIPPPSILRGLSCAPRVSHGVTFRSLFFARFSVSQRIRKHFLEAEQDSCMRGCREERNSAGCSPSLSGCKDCCMPRITCPSGKIYQRAVPIAHLSKASMVHAIQYHAFRNRSLMVRRVWNIIYLVPFLPGGFSPEISPWKNQVMSFLPSALSSRIDPCGAVFGHTP